jgi:hypothetical protein
MTNELSLWRIYFFTLFFLREIDEFQSAPISVIDNECFEIDKFPEGTLILSNFVAE